METRCKICERMKFFEGEGNWISGYWICSWNCVKRAIENLLISQKDIEDRCFDEQLKMQRKVERDLINEN